MYFCKDCHETFDEPHRYEERHGLEHGPYEKWSVCPYCGSPDWSEATTCDICGEPFAADDAVTVGDKHCVCPECADEADDDDDEDDTSDIFAVAIDADALRQAAQLHNQRKAGDAESKQRGDAAAIAALLTKLQASSDAKNKEAQRAAAEEAVKQTAELVAMFYKQLTTEKIPFKLKFALCMQLHSKLIGGTDGK